MVEWFVEKGSFDFEDGSGIAQAEERQSLEQRISELERRLSEWKRAGADVSKADIAAREKDLESLKKRLSALRDPEPPAGSFFRYELELVGEEDGAHPPTLAQLKEYYERVNEHNRVVFKDRKPPPLETGKAGYVGIERCTVCHKEERNFWNRTGHAKAYATLVNQNKQFNLDCVSCHVTGYEQPGGSTVTFVDQLKDVQCETCHGPGSLHVKTPIKQTIALKPERAMCASHCHHPPHVHADWDAKLAFTKIIGPGHGAPAK
jgi:hypothetical protein